MKSWRIMGAVADDNLADVTQAEMFTVLNVLNFYSCYASFDHLVFPVIAAGDQMKHNVTFNKILWV